jgi:hypothetical protein
MDLLIDECVPVSVARVFARRGHKIFDVARELGRRAPDEAVVETADEHNLILITWNYRDFKKLISRRPPGNKLLHRYAGLISFICDEARGAQRAEQVIESIEFEYQQCLKRRDKRLIVAVYIDELRICY